LSGSARRRGRQPANRQPAALAGGNDLANSGYGSLKTFVGRHGTRETLLLRGFLRFATWDECRVSLGGFVKHVADAAWPARFLPKEGEPE